MHWWLLGLSLVALFVASIWFAAGTRGPAVALATDSESAAHETAPAEESAEIVRVETVKPVKGGIARTTTRPATVIAFESAQLYSKVSGYLKLQPVDIGSQVKRGQVLAEIDAPELDKDLQRAKSAVDQTKTEVAQAIARLATTKADYEASLAAVKQSEAELERAVAARSFREKQYERMKALYKAKSIDERLVDEKLDEKDAAIAAEHAAEAAIATAKAQVNAALAKIQQAESDVAHAKAQVEVAEAAEAKAGVYVDYTKIVSPYDGVITKRNFFRGEFIRAAEQGGNIPLLAVEQIDVMRVVADVADPDVPFTNVDDAAEVEIFTLPGRTFHGKVSRIADAEAADSRTMRVEIDVPNDQRLLRQGMYGQVTIHLDDGIKAISIPSSSLVGDRSRDNGKVYIVKDGKAHLQSVILGFDNGLSVEVLKGLSTEDDVVRYPNSTLVDGSPLEIIPADSPKPAASAAHAKT